jgi:DNA-directed RNA polymerase subunit H (RpoH/RPB5)
MLVDHKLKDESCLIYYLTTDKKKPFSQLLGVNNNGTINPNFGLFEKKSFEDGTLKENTKTIIFISIIDNIYPGFLKKDEELPQPQKIINTYHNFYKKKNNNIFLQLFEIKRFLFNVMEHHLVPKHEIVSEEDYINEVVKKYKITSKNQLPIIKKDDPIARYIGLQPEQICKITRRSDSVGTYIGFRICK